MKKKYIFLLIIIVLLISFIIYDVISINLSKPLKVDKKLVLVTNSHINYAWAFTYSGTAIFNDGTIYDWNYNKESFYPDKMSFEEQSNWILKEGKIRKTVVKEKDIKRLTKLIEEVNDSIKLEYSGADMGKNSLDVWNYSTNKKITIKQTGDSSGTNKTSKAKSIRRITSKYFDIFKR